MKTNTKKLVMSAMFAALTCIATMIIKIPIPAASGYIHPGDAVVILSGIFLGPVSGFFAAGIGSAMADLLSGYAIYSPISFVIKGLVAFLVAMAYRFLIQKAKVAALLCSGIINLCLVVAGYFCYEAVLYGVPAALPGIVANIIQGGAGLVLTFVLYPILMAIPEVKKMTQFSSCINCKK